MQPSKPIILADNTELLHKIKVDFTTNKNNTANAIAQRLNVPVGIVYRALDIIYKK